jgi:hypothetical protein
MKTRAAMAFAACLLWTIATGAQESSSCYRQRSIRPSRANALS